MLNIPGVFFQEHLLANRHHPNFNITHYVAYEHSLSMS